MATFCTALFHDMTLRKPVQAVLTTYLRYMIASEQRNTVPDDIGHLVLDGGFLQHEVV